MNQFTKAILIAFCAILCGCNPDAKLQEIVPAKDKDTALYYIELLRKGDCATIEKQLDPTIITPDVRSTLEKMISFLPKENPLSIKIVGFNVFVTPEHTDKNISFEFQYPKMWILANVAMRTSQSGFTIVGFNVHGIPDSLEHLHQFTLTGKSALQLTILGLAIIIPLFILYSLVKCVRCKIKRKWLWILFILVGIGAVSINWSSGRWAVLPLYLQLFGAGAVASPFGPWTISVSFPLGALMFLIYQRRKSQKVDQEAKLD